MKIHLIYGAAGGLILILFHFVRYLIDPMWVLGEHRFTFLAIYLAMFCLMPILAMRAWKRQTGGEALYGTALKYVLVGMFTASTVSGLYETVFDHFIGKGLALENETRIKAMIKRQSDEAYLFGYQMSAETSKEEMKRIREELALDDSRQAGMDDRWQNYLDRMDISFSRIMLRILLSLFFVLPLSMLVALFVRSRKPRVATVSVPEEQCPQSPTCTA